NAGSLLMDMERPTEALTMARYALDAYMSEYGEDDPLTSVWAGNLLRMALPLKVDLEEDRDDLLRLLVADEAKTLSAATIPSGDLLGKVHWSNRHQIAARLTWRSGEEVASATDAATMSPVRRPMPRHAAMSGLAGGEDINGRRAE